MDQIKFVGGLILTSLFALALVIFSINFASENNAFFNIQSQPGFNDTYNALGSNLSVWRTETINSTDTFYRSEIDSSFTSKTGGVFKLGPATALSTSDTILKQTFKSLFGSDSSFAVVLYVLIGFLGTVLALLIWKTIKGNPG